jgi:charged multivesicular body protein 7
VDPADDSVALLYDKNGIIAGIQAQIPHKQILKPGQTFRFDRVPMFQNITIRGEDFFVITAYFVNPFSICSEGRTLLDLALNGTGTGLWFQNGPSANFLIEVSKDRATGWSKGWSKNNCWRAMGNHNFWQTEKYEEHNCNEIRPAFVLFDQVEDEMLGFGFTIPGSVNLTRYESPPNAVISAIINPTPPCLTAMNDRVGAATLHIYFVDQPWTITCQ